MHATRLSNCILATLLRHCGHCNWTSGSSWSRAVSNIFSMQFSHHAALHVRHLCQGQSIDSLVSIQTMQLTPLPRMPAELNFATEYSFM